MILTMVPVEKRVSPRRREFGHGAIEGVAAPESANNAAAQTAFIPLLTLTSEVAIGGAFTRAKLMVYLVAFQNGFFWKSFFEQRRTAPTAPALT